MPSSLEDIKNQQLKQAHERHNEALKRLEEIKKESRALEAESKQLETESYVKSRFLSDSFGRDPNMIKEYGIRLKEIQKRIRDIVVILDQLQEEKIGSVSDMMNRSKISCICCCF